jgi:hypothetical protein
MTGVVAGYPLYVPEMHDSGITLRRYESIVMYKSPSFAAGVK